MFFLPGMWIVWGVLLLSFLSVKIYAARLSRDEDDQLVLDDSFEHIKSEQAVLVARLGRVQPLASALLWALIAMTVIIAGYYVHDMFRQLSQ